MQSTNKKCGLNRTSSLDRWMVTEDSPVYVKSKKLGTLADLSSDWTARLILANTLYFNMVNVLDDGEADKVVQTTFQKGGDAGQRLLASTYHWVYQKLESGEIPDQIASRIMLYLFSINWTVAKPYPDYVPQERPDPSEDDLILRLVGFDDGDHMLMVGGENANADAIATMSFEISRLVLAGFADVDFLYFSNREKALAVVPTVQKYLLEKWGHKFVFVDETGKGDIDNG